MIKIEDNGALIDVMFEDKKLTITEEEAKKLIDKLEERLKTGWC